MTENERIRVVRKDHSLTMEEFGKRLGVGTSTISMIESGKNAVTNQMRVSICKEFNVNETWLRTGDESGGKYLQKTAEDEITDLFTEIMNAPADDDLRSLARAFSRLTPQQRRDAAALAKALAESYNASTRFLPSEDKKLAAARSGDRVEVLEVSRSAEEAALPPPYTGDI